VPGFEKLLAELRTNVGCGALLLDVVDPDWWRHARNEEHRRPIDVTLLDITSPTCCVLAQWSGDITGRGAYGLGLEMLGLSLSDAPRYGFTVCLPDRPDDAPPMFNALTGLWRELIVRRRAAAERVEVCDGQT
jgi:hypothetical protein